MKLVRGVHRQHVCGRDLLADRLGFDVHDGVAVGEGAAARRAGHRVLQIPTDVAVRDSGGRVLLVLERPLLNRPVNLSQVIDAGILLRGSARLDEVGDSDRGQKPDNGHHDHDFYQRETRLAGGFDVHTNFVFLFGGVNEAAGGLLISSIFVHKLPVAAA